MLPIDWRAGIADLAEVAERYRAAAGDAFDLSPVGEALAAVATALEAFHRDAADGTIAAPAANRVLRGLGRILVPLNYVRGPRFTHDPALNVPPLPAIAGALKLSRHNDDTLGFALVQLLRGRNRVVAALREARALVERR